MAHTSWKARTAGILIGAVLALPSLGTLLPEGNLSVRLNRNLTDLPEASAYAEGPIAAFGQFSDWYSERILLGVRAVKFMQQVRYYWLRDAGVVNTLRTGPLVYLSTHAPEPLTYAAFDNSCRPLNADTRPEFLEAVDQVEEWAAYWQSKGIGFANLIVPSKPVLYADELPRYVPYETRMNCLMALEGEGYVSALAAMSEATYYPLETLRERRDDPFYYPALNFHADSESLVDALLSTAADLGLPDLQPELVTIERRADLRGIYQIDRMVTVRQPASFETSHTEQRDFRNSITEEIGPINSARRWTPNTPTNTAPILIFGNSFSNFAGPFARIFNAEVIQFGTNSVSEERLTFMLSEIVDRYAVGTVIFVHHDGDPRLYAPVLENLASPENVAAARIEPSDIRERFRQGWFAIEPRGVWSHAGETARLILPPQAEDRTMISLTGRIPGFFEPTREDYSITVCGETYPLPQAEWRNQNTFILLVPISECSGSIDLSFDSPEALTTPADLGISADQRSLGIFLDLIEFRRP